MTYHRINNDGDIFFPGVSIETFEDQMRILAELFTVCRLEELIDRVQTNDLPEKAVAVTFDDGYRDNYTNAFPILKKYSIPATIFLATDAIGTGRQLWHDDVFSAFRETRVRELRGFGPLHRALPLGSLPMKVEAQNAVLRYLCSVNACVRQAAIREIRKSLDVDEAAPAPERLMLSWDEISEMHHFGIRFGAHTASHQPLSRLRTEDARDEICRSKQIIEGKLGANVSTFAYPFGRREDFTATTKMLVEEANFRCAVTTIFGSNDSETDLYEMRRIAPWNARADTFGPRLLYYGLFRY